MHSSGMRTARLLTISHACTVVGVVPAQGVYLPGGVPAQGVYLPGGSVPAQGGVPARGEGYLPRYSSPCGQTDTCETITFANFVCGR